MNFTQSFLQELEQESITTRKMLERVPEDKYNWKPHEKSMSLIQLASHIGEIPQWINMVLNTTELDFAQNEYKPTIIHSGTELMQHFEKSLEVGKKALSGATDGLMEKNWLMRTGDKIHLDAPKREMIRHCFCQVVHHRAQLGVYLRLLDIPIPGSYGPSADETAF